MNRFIILLGGVLLFAGCGNKTVKDAESSASGLSGKIQLSGAFALYPMAVKWADEFKKLHPDVKIDISGGGAGKGMTDALAGVVDIGMVSREVYPEEIEKGAFPIASVKDAVVPTVSAENPHIGDVLRIGLKKDIASRLWNKELTTWGQILGTSAGTSVHVFTRSDACGAAETFAAWFGKKQEDLKATAVFGDPGVAAAVQKDKLGIGFNNLGYAYDQKTKKPNEGLAIIPLDVNDNGVVDPEEDFYGTSDALIEAINDGRFPSPPARDLYLVTKGKPTRPEVIAFIEYALSEGQQYAGETGYIGLSEEKLRRELQKIKN
jgi:phosphate transport system substrate-binding protein